MPEIAVSLSGGGILIEYGSGDTAEHVVIRNNDLFEFPQGNRVEGNGLRFETNFKGEDAVTSALIRLREGKKTRVAFTAGHGETATDEPDIRKPGLAAFKSRLGALGAEVGELNLLRDDVPGDLELLLVVAPKTAFKPEEVAKLKGYMDRGGPVLLLLGNREPSGLDEVLKANNLGLGKGVIVDPVFNINRMVLLVEAPVSRLIQHPIVDPLMGRYVLLPYMAPLQVLVPKQGSPGNPAVVTVPILRTSKESWAETDLANRRPTKDKDDEAGPITVGAAAFDRPVPGSGNPEGKPRMVVISSPSAADNYTLDLEATNLDLLMNAVRLAPGPIRPDRDQAQGARRALARGRFGPPVPPGHGPDRGGRPGHPRPGRLDLRGPTRLSARPVENHAAVCEHHDDQETPHAHRPAHPVLHGPDPSVVGRSHREGKGADEYPGRAGVDERPSGRNPPGRGR